MRASSRGITERAIPLAEGCNVCNTICAVSSVPGHLFGREPRREQARAFDATRAIKRADELCAGVDNGSPPFIFYAALINNSCRE